MSTSLICHIHLTSEDYTRMDLTTEGRRKIAGGVNANIPTVSLW